MIRRSLTAPTTTHHSGRALVGMSGKIGMMMVAAAAPMVMAGAAGPGPGSPKAR